MFLPAISKAVREIFDDFDLEELANYPNVYGVYKQSELVIDIVQGDVSLDAITDSVIDLSLKISISASKLTNEKGEYEEIERDLETLISLIIKRVRKRVLQNCNRIRLDSFQKFTPESGKHRALISFIVPAHLTSDWEIPKDAINRVEQVTINYR